jgi:hypothetical protein
MLSSVRGRASRSIGPRASDLRRTPCHIQKAGTVLQKSALTFAEASGSLARRAAEVVALPYFEAA